MRNLCLFVCIPILSLLSSCVDNPTKSIDKLNAFVLEVEETGSMYNLEDWENADLKFEELLSKVQNDYNSMTEEEREQVVMALGRYYGLQAKRNMEEAAQDVQNVLEALPAFIEGFSGAFE